MDSGTDRVGDDLNAPLETANEEVLSLIVPVFNEGENFPALIAAVEKHLVQPFVLHVVYDFDEDTTVPVAQSLQPTRPWLKLTKNDLGRGPANAIKAGFQAVGSGPALVVMADLSDDLNDVAIMREHYRAGSGIVCASRYMKGGKQIGGPFLKRTLSYLAGVSLYWCAGLPTHDATNNFRLYDAKFVNDVGIESTAGFEIALELTAKGFARGVKITEIPTTWSDRVAGESNFKLWKWLPKYVKWYFVALKAGWNPWRPKSDAR